MIGIHRDGTNRTMHLWRFDITIDGWKYHKKEIKKYIQEQKEEEE